MAAPVLVFVEIRGGEVRKASLEALAAAARLGGAVEAVALGPDAPGLLPLLGAHGAARVHVAADPALALYDPEAYAAALAAAWESSGAGLLLAGGTAMGRDLLPRAAARRRAVGLSDVTEIAREGDGTLKARRPVYSGKAFLRVAVPAGTAAAVTLRPNVFPAGPGNAGGAAERVDLPSPKPGRIRATRVEAPAAQELDVAEASVVVSGGRGLKGPENFHLVRDLAAALGGAVGASRAVVDAGWIEHKHQVGQTGKVVSPGLYVACGISGAIQHLAGMNSSKVIVAINRDKDAPIFKVADYGIVGDLFEVLPKLTEELRKR